MIEIVGNQNQLLARLLLEVPGDESAIVGISESCVNRGSALPGQASCCDGYTDRNDETAFGCVPLCPEVTQSFDGEDV